MKKNVFLISVFFISLSQCFNILISSAFAQTFSLSVYPPLLEVMIMPGKSITQVYRLENTGDEMEINTQILSFKPKDEHGNIRFLQKTEPSQIEFGFENADISLGKPFILKAGQTKQIILKIGVPENVREDDYYFTLLFSSRPKEKIGSSTLFGAGILGTNILLTVSKSGKPPKNGEIEEFSIKNCKKIGFLCLIDSFEKPEFLLRLKNIGKAFWKPFGKIKIVGLFGQKWEQEILPENVLVNSIRQIQIATPSASPLFLFGPYRAKTEFRLEENEETKILSTSISFWAIPGKFILTILTAILILLGIKKIISLRM